MIAALTADKMLQVARYKVASCEEIDAAVVSQQTNISDFSHISMRIDVAE